MNHAIIEVVFKVLVNLDHGEEVRLCGNVPALGCDNPDRAIPLFTSPKDKPWWHTKESIFLPAEKDYVKYRYCIFSGGRFNRWEGDGDGSSFRRGLNFETLEQTVKTAVDIFGNLDIDSAKLQIPSIGTCRTSSAAAESHSHRAKLFNEWSRRTIAKNTNNNNNTSNNEVGVIIVSYFLPVILNRSSNGEWTAIWDRENLLSFNFSENMRATWVGSVPPVPIEEQESVISILSNMNCIPIFIDQNTHYQFYEGFCKQNLWLSMHHIADVYGPINISTIGAKSQQDLWYTYSTVHKPFRDTVVGAYHPGDLIWIHGFHLMLLPSFIRRRLQQAKIGYFFHTPFPSSEIWKTITRRDCLLRGILAADQIGFHLFEYARHFLVSCHRLLGYRSDSNPAGVMTINIDGREVAISCIHVGVDLPYIQRHLQNNTIIDDINTWTSKLAGKTVVCGIDKLERLKGIPLKLNAIDYFMKENPQWIGKLVFAIVGISASERGNDYIQTVHDVKIMVARLNSKYSAGNGDFLVHFEERNEKEMSIRHRLAFFAASDILFITAPREGLNLLPMEFTLAKQQVIELWNKQSPLSSSSGLLREPTAGLIIISEFTSSARVMRGGIIINPWRSNEVKDALKHALEISPNELADRVRRNLEFSTRLTTGSWATQVLQDLKGIEKSDDPNEVSTFGFGTGFRVMGVRAGFQTLNVSEVLKSYRVARHRLILLDWGGTIENSRNTDSLHAYGVTQGHVQRDGLSDNLKDILEELCSDQRNCVFVVSGKDLNAVSEYFSSVKGLGLAAEHGCYYRWPRIDDEHNNKTKWQTMISVSDTSWKDACNKVMDIYVKRTHGTYIEKKGNALIWQFRDADPEFGFIQSKELEDHLKELLSGYPVEVLRGGGVSDGYIEVRLAGLSKGSFLVHALETMKSLDKYCDFVLTIGDDQSDEPMFEQVSRMQSVKGMDAFSVTVGKKPTSALSCIDDPNAVLELLNTLAKQLLREKRYFSSFDLPSHAQPNATSNTPFQRQGFQPTNSLGIPAAPPTFSPITSGRTMSVGNLSGLTSEQSSRLSGRKNFNGPMFPAPLLQRTESSAHLSMSQYLTSIREDDQDDDGLFF